MTTLFSVKANNGLTYTLSEDGTNIQLSDGTTTWTLTQASKISDPSGGATVDSEARTAIAAIIDALEAAGISSAT